MFVVLSLVATRLKRKLGIGIGKGGGGGGFPLNGHVTLYITGMFFCILNFRICTSNGYKHPTILLGFQ